MNALLLIREGTEVLTKANVLSPKLDAEYLLAEALHMPRLNLLLSLRDEVSADAEGRFRDMLERRKNHEPLQYILGTEDFFGLRGGRSSNGSSLRDAGFVRVGDLRGCWEAAFRGDCFAGGAHGLS
jgi:hypothetical protein